MTLVVIAKIVSNSDAGMSIDLQNRGVQREKRRRMEQMQFTKPVLTQHMMYILTDQVIIPVMSGAQMIATDYLRIWGDLHLGIKTVDHVTTFFRLIFPSQIAIIFALVVNSLLRYSSYLLLIYLFSFVG